VFTVDRSSDPGVCTVSGTNGATVSYTGAGRCVIDADQAGNGTYASAHQVQRMITVSKRAQSIAFTAPDSKLAYPDGSASLSATGGGSGNPVVFTVDASSVGVCTVSGTNGATVNYMKPGQCVIDADQAGNNTYAAAPRVSGTIMVNWPVG
jgi:hypothetical protein